MTFSGYDERFSGKNLYSLYTILDEAKREGSELGIVAAESTLTASFMSPGFAQRIIFTSMKLGFVGIVLPVIFLLSSPGASVPSWVFSYLPTVQEWVMNWGVLLLQFGILMISCFYGLRLFLLMIFEVSYEVPDLATALGGDREEGDSDEDQDNNMSIKERLVLRISGLDDLGPGQ